MADIFWVCPAGVFKIALRGRGAGGGGRGGGGTDYGQDGGGGGAWSEKRGYVVIPGNSYLVRQGLGTGPSGNGGETLFVTGAVFRAAPGVAGQFLSGGPGGKAVDSVGDTCYDGGDGGFADQFFPAIQPAGGGGGGAGGPSGPGNDGGIPTGGLDGDGDTSGGLGGTGNGVPGIIGVAPGGGGGGGGGNFTAGGGGGDGFIAIWDDTANPPDPFAVAPIVSFGTFVPPTPPVTTGRKSAFVM